jgi:hypothetical protein
MRTRSSAPLVSAVLVILALSGCQGAPEDADAVPDTPDGTVQTVLEGLAQHRPEVVWRALPPSYQEDVRGLLASFAENMDPALFERAVAVSRKGVMVLQGKKDLILSTETVVNSGIDPESIDGIWESSVHFADTFLASDLARLDAYPTLDVDGVLKTSGASMMDHAAGISVGDDGADTVAARLAALENTGVALVSRDGDSAVVLVTTSDREATEVPMTRVEGRWLPNDVVARWPGTIERTRERIEFLGSDDAAQMKVQALFAIGLAEGLINQIGEMEAPADLDNLIGGILGSLVQQQNQTGRIATESES